MNDLSKISVVLPSLDPDEKLTAVIDGLLEYGFTDIILVNDGSKAENLHYFTDMAAQHPIYRSLRFLTAPMNCPASEIDPIAFSSMLNEARRHFSYVLLDAPAGIEDGFQLAARYADRILLVTGPDPASVRDASRAGEVLELMGKQNIRLIVNRMDKKMANLLNITVDDIMDQAGLPLIGVVPEDRSVILAAAFRQPLMGYTRKGAAAACSRIAKRIIGYPTPIQL